VNTAVHEALADMEQAVKGLREPLDSKPMRARLQETGPLGPQTVSMKDYLSLDRITPEL
jgi:hypothetical protein